MSYSYGGTSARVAALTADPGAPRQYPVGGYSGHYFPDAGQSFGSPPGPPPGQRRRGLGWVLAVVFLLLFAAGGTVAVVAVWRLFPKKAAGTMELPVNVAATSHAGDLRQLLLPAPPGSTSCSADVPGTNEQISLEQLAGADDKNSAAVLKSLKLYGFQRGAIRCWVTTGVAVMVILAQFDSPEHATTYHRSNVDDEVKRSDRTNVGLDAKGVPSGLQSVDAKPDAHGLVATLAIGQRGDVAFAVFTKQPYPAPSDQTSTLARVQYGLL